MVAAAALMFCATGAAMATADKDATDGKKVTAGTAAQSLVQPAPAPTSVSLDQVSAVRATTLMDNAPAIARANAEAKAERTADVATARKAVAVAARKAAAATAARKAAAAAARKADVAAMAARRAATAKVARSVERKNLAARAVETERAEQAHGWQLPITNPVKTSDFGYRWGRLHAGMDFAAPEGTDLASMSGGTVAYASEMSGYGNLVKIRYWDGTVSFYGHMSTISVNVGEKVEAGEIIGQSGNTGHSTGPHLHLEIHPDGGEAIDPAPWLADHNIAP